MLFSRFRDKKYSARNFVEFFLTKWVFLQRSMRSIYNLMITFQRYILNSVCKIENSFNLTKINILKRMKTFIFVLMAHALAKCIYRRRGLTVQTSEDLFTQYEYRTSTHLYRPVLVIYA